MSERLGLLEKDGSDERRELLVGVRLVELSAPAVIELHITRMGFVSQDELGGFARFAPIATLLLLCRTEWMLAIVPTVLEIDLIGSKRHFFSGDRVFDVLYSSDRHSVYSLFFFLAKCAGHQLDAVGSLHMCHVDSSVND